MAVLRLAFNAWATALIPDNLHSLRVEQDDYNQHGWPVWRVTTLTHSGVAAPVLVENRAVKMTLSLRRLTRSKADAFLAELTSLLEAARVAPAARAGG